MHQRLVSHKQPTKVALGLCALAILFYAYEYLLRIVPSVLAASLTQRYHLTAFTLGNLSAFYYYAYTPAQLVVGPLLDRGSIKHWLALAAIICSLGTILFGHSVSFYGAASGRFLIGVGSAFAFIGTLKLGAYLLSPRAFGALAGITSSVGFVVAAASNVALSKALQTYSWETLLNMLASIGLLLAICFWCMACKMRQHAHLLPKSNIPPLQSLKNLCHSSNFWMNGLAGCLLYTPVSTFAELWAIPYLQSAYRASSTTASYLIGCFFIGWAIAAPLWGMCATHIRAPKKLLQISGVVSGFLCCILLIKFAHTTQALAILLGMLGVASAGEVIVILNATQLCPPTLQGTSIAATNFLIMASGALCQPLIGGLLVWIEPNQVTHAIYHAHAYNLALIIFPLCCFLSAYCAHRIHHV